MNMKLLNKSFLIIIFIFSLFPIWIMFSGSLMDIKGFLAIPPKLFPTNPTLVNFRSILKDPIIWTWGRNSLLVVLGTVFISVSISLFGGYAFALSKKSKKKEILWTILLSALLFPRISILIPQYVLLSKMNLSGSILGVILPCVYTPVGLFISRKFFESVPVAIIESAKVDGASDLRILINIIIPLTKPLVSVLALFSALGALQDYIWQMLVLQKTERQTLLVGLMRLAMKRGGDVELGINPIGRYLTVGVILLFPLLVLFLIANKYFVSALEGAVKE